MGFRVSDQGRDGRRGRATAAKQPPPIDYERVGAGRKVK